MGKHKAIVMKIQDNVATAVEELQAGVEVGVTFGSKTITITLLDKIPFGHKFAIRDMIQGEKVIKYGEPIGAANQDIKAGQHVHVHNISGLRGRGDLGAKVKS